MTQPLGTPDLPGVPIREAKPIGPNCPVVVLEGSGIPEAMIALEAALKAGSGVGVVVLDSYVDYADLEARALANMAAAPPREKTRILSARDLLRGSEPMPTFRDIKSGRDPKGRRWVDANRAPSRPGKRR